MWNPVVSTWVLLARSDEYSKWCDFSLLCNVLPTVLFWGVEDAFEPLEAHTWYRTRFFVHTTFWFEDWGKLSGTSQPREKPAKCLLSYCFRNKKSRGIQNVFLTLLPNYLTTSKLGWRQIRKEKPLLPTFLGILKYSENIGTETILHMYIHL